VTSLSGIGKRYGRGSLIIKAVDLELEPGTPLVVLGANGSGKSTLLRIIAGCAAPTRGRVIGKPATVGYVPDRFPAQLRMPAASYLRHLRRIRPTPGGGDPFALLTKLGFSGGLRTPMNQLSKGNAQKVGLAQALCGGAPLLVLDEPWSGLDVDVRPVLTAALESAAAGGTTVVLTDHTGTSDALPRHRKVLLRNGALVDAPTDEARTVAITLRCVDPGRVAGELAAHGHVEHRRTGLVVRAPATRVDALLLTALRLGCSVREVRECVS